MKALFLAGVAALFLATGTAHAYPPRYYDCGKAFVKIEMGAGSTARGRIFPKTWTIQENWEREVAKNLNPINSVNFRCTRDDNGDDKCWLNGKFCHEMSAEKGKEQFGDEY